MNRSPARILVVDDEANVVATLQAILAREGHIVETVQTGADARVSIASRPYDVVLTDLRLPDAEGLDIVDTLRERQPGVPTIVLTGFGSLDSAVQAVHKGVYDYLLKPCDVEELKRTVQRAIDHGHRTRETSRLPENVRSLMSDLESTKRELELTLARERAIVAQLKERDELRNQFIANVSHELKTPLTAIRGYAELLLRRIKPDGDDEARKPLQVVLRAADELRRLVEELLAMVEAETGNVRVELRSTDLREAIVAAVTLARPAAEERGITVSASLPERLPPVHADPARIAQVLNNLVSNALKFTQRGGSVTLEALVGGGHVHALVRDTGIGIPEDELSRLFSRFFRASTAPTAGPGLGLGLYITRSIVEAHGGLIWIESAAGKGTTVHFTVPFEEQGAELPPAVPV